jgi:hypothetical protein
VYTHPPYGIPVSKRHNFPLLSVRYINQRLLERTYKPSSLSESRGRSTTHIPRGYFDIEEGLSVDVLDLVDPWLQFSVFEDGGGHRWQRKFDNGGNTNE